MYKNDTILCALHQTEEALQRIMSRFEPVSSVSYFTDSAEEPKI